MLPLTLALLTANVAPAFHFEIDPERTFTNGRLQLQFWTSGQLVGDFDSKVNPKGTQTVPGNVVSPGENRPVVARTVWSMETQTDFHTVGSFDLTLDEEQKQVAISNYRAERLAEGPLVLDSTYWLDAAPFRSLQPDSGWAFDGSGGIRSRVNLDRLRITQVPGSRSGSLTLLGDGWYRVSVNFMATVKVDVLEFDQSGPLEFTMAASLVGNVKWGDRAAEFGYPIGQGGDNWSRQVRVPMEDFALDIQNATGETARFRLFQTVDKFAMKIQGRRQFSARGSRIDQPSL